MSFELQMLYNWNEQIFDPYDEKSNTGLQTCSNSKYRIYKQTWITNVVEHYENKIKELMSNYDNKIGLCRYNLKYTTVLLIIVVEHWNCIIRTNSQVNCSFEQWKLCSGVSLDIGVIFWQASCVNSFKWAK